jgi:hypothetical protein
MLCVVVNYVDIFDSIEFATIYVAFLVNICMTTKNATCVFDSKYTCCILSSKLYWCI